MNKFNLYLFIVLTLAIVLSIRRYIHNNGMTNIKIPKISITHQNINSKNKKNEVLSDELNSLFEADLFTEDDIDSDFSL